MKKSNFFKNIGTVLGVTLSVFLTSYVVFAQWSGPTATPPGGNIPAPLSGGSDTNYKSGALGIGGVFETDTHTHLATTGGNVGIGTTSPSSKLHISQAVHDYNKRFEFLSGYSQERDFGIRGVNDAPNTQTNLHIDALNGAGVFVRNVMVLTHLGNVGIGTTSPGTKLVVDYSGAANGVVFTRTDSNAKMFFHASAGDPQIRFDRNGDIWAMGNDAGIFSIERSSNLSGSGTGLYINSSGNVGIGTTSPSTLIDMQDGGTSKNIGIRLRAMRRGLDYNNSFIQFDGPRSDTADGNTTAGRGYIVLPGEDGDNWGKLFIGAGTANQYATGTPAQILL